MIDLDLRESDEDVARENLIAFYRRSVASRPQFKREPFIVSTDQQQFDTHEIKYIEPTKVPPSALKTGAPPAPTIDSFNPYFGDYHGGGIIDIRGSNFIDGADAYLDNIISSNTTFISDTELKAVIPFDDPGGISGSFYKDVNVMVVNVPNRSDTLGTYHYQYPPSQFGFIDPFTGSYNGGWGQFVTGFSGSFYVPLRVWMALYWSNGYDIRQNYYLGNFTVNNVSASPAGTSFSFFNAVNRAIDGRNDTLVQCSYTFASGSVLPGASFVVNFYILDVHYNLNYGPLQIQVQSH